MSTALAEMPRSVPVPRPVSVAATRNLTKSYGPIVALRNLNLDLRAGELLALLGPNGAGKTTLVRMLLGLARPDSGSVSVFGADPHQGQRAASSRRHAAGRARAGDPARARAH